MVFAAGRCAGPAAAEVPIFVSRRIQVSGAAQCS
jgi:hypothetical protein